MDQISLVTKAWKLLWVCVIFCRPRGCISGTKLRVLQWKIRPDFAVCRRSLEIFRVSQSIVACNLTDKTLKGLFEV